MISSFSPSKLGLDNITFMLAPAAVIKTPCFIKENTLQDPYKTPRWLETIIYNSLFYKDMRTGGNIRNTLNNCCFNCILNILTYIPLGLQAQTLSIRKALQSLSWETIYRPQSYESLSMQTKFRASIQNIVTKQISRFVLLTKLTNVPLIQTAIVIIPFVVHGGVEIDALPSGGRVRG